MDVHGKRFNDNNIFFLRISRTLCLPLRLYLHHIKFNDVMFQELLGYLRDALPLYLHVDPRSGSLTTKYVTTEQPLHHRAEMMQFIFYFTETSPKMSLLTPIRAGYKLGVQAGLSAPTTKPKPKPAPQPDYLDQVIQRIQIDIDDAEEEEQKLIDRAIAESLSEGDMDLTPRSTQPKSSKTELIIVDDDEVIPDAPVLQKDVEPKETKTTKTRKQLFEDMALEFSEEDEPAKITTPKPGFKSSFKGFQSEVISKKTKKTESPEETPNKKRKTDADPILIIEDTKPQPPKQAVDEGDGEVHHLQLPVTQHSLIVEIFSLNTNVSDFLNPRADEPSAQQHVLSHYFGSQNLPTSGEQAGQKKKQAAPAAKPTSGKKPAAAKPDKKKKTPAKAALPVTLSKSKFSSERIDKS